jgi:uncharacterized protein YegL
MSQAIKIKSAKRIKAMTFLIDTSSSMVGELDAVLQSLKDLVPLLMQWEESNGGKVEIALQVIQFGSDVSYVVGSNGVFVPLEQVQLPDTLTANGLTSMGEGVETTAISLEAFYDDLQRYSKSVVVLLSDGEPTDCDSLPLDVFDTSAFLKGTTRISIAFGEHANKRILESFLSRDMLELGLFEASNAYELVKQLKNATMSAIDGKNVNLAEARKA